MAELDPGRGLAARLVTLPDGRRLRVVEAGRGTPPVVFEAGLAASASEWVTVQRMVAAQTRTIAYDRAGHGGSDVDPRPRTLQNMARDLNDLLDALDISEPVTLVGHSWGGPIARAFVRDYPERVAGLVFVDATTTGVMTKRAARLARGMATVMAAIQRVGLPNPTGPMMAKAIGPDIPAEDRALMIRDMVAKQDTTTTRREAREIGSSLPALKDWEVNGYPSVPVAAILGASADRGQSAKVRAQLIDQARADMARAHGTLVVVAGAGHLVPQQRPTQTGQAILDLVGRVRVEAQHAGHQRRVQPPQDCER